MQNGTAGGSEEVGPSRALVPIDRGAAVPAPCPRRPLRSQRPLAGFITQLLACRDALPPYRARRRAEPAAASARYDDEARSVTRPRRFERVL